MEADGILVGMSGRRLQVTDRMRRENADADGHYHLGLKGLFELYPTKVRERWLADQKLKHWDNPNKNALVDAARDLESLEELHPSPTANFLERLHKENLEQSIELLNAWDKAYPQLKPLFDCIMYQVRDGSWRVIIDTSLVGNLEEAVELGEYVLTRDIVSIAEHLSVSVNVHEDGNLLEIVGMCCKLLATAAARAQCRPAITHLCFLSQPRHARGIHCERTPPRRSGAERHCARREDHLDDHR